LVAALRQRVGTCVDLSQSIHGDMGVTLGGGEARVPEHFLDPPQVRAGVEQVGGAAMPERMRMEIGPAFHERSVPSHQVLNLTFRQTSAPRSEKQCGGVLGSCIRMTKGRS